LENNFDGEIIQTVDGVSFRMKAAYDFSFLKKYGRVFKVFDDQDSGNICFGVQKAGEKYFVKFAGAPTARCCDAPAQAVERLRVSLPVYQELRHPSLIQLVSWEEVGQGDSAGVAAVFHWAEGDCMGRMYEEAHQRFMALPVKARLQVYWDVLEFLDYVNRTGSNQDTGALTPEISPPQWGAGSYFAARPKSRPACGCNFPVFPPPDSRSFETSIFYHTQGLL